MMHKISNGFYDNDRAQVAALYWEAFGAKLGRVMGPTPLALRFIEQNVNPEFAFVTRDTGGYVSGVAGFKTSEGAFLGGDLAELAQVYGWLSTCWRAPLLALMERDLAEDVLLMDGICVGSDARGKGIGTALLDAVKAKAREIGCASVRLDVIDTNHKARALYERQGFEARTSKSLGPFKHIFGFSSATQMVWS